MECAAPTTRFRRAVKLSGIALSFAIVLTAPGSARPALQGPPPAAVRAVRAEMRETMQREAVTGSLRAVSEASLAAREEGPVLEVVVRAGRYVRKGEPLIRLDDRRLRAQRAELVATAAEARATRIRREAEGAEADQDLAALEAASGGDAVSERELRMARTRAASAAADVDAAKQRELALAAQLELMDLRIADATLTAPFDGTVVARHVEVGEWVQPGTMLVELVSTSHLEVWLDVPERLLPSIRSLPDSLMIATGGAGMELSASAPRVIPRVDPRTRMFPVVLTIDGEIKDQLSPGSSASAWLPVGAAKASLMVPKDALVYRPGGISVMTVQGKDEGGVTLSGVANQVPVEILFEAERDVALAPGSLPEGAVVIVEGNERLFPGTPVQARIGAASKSSGDHADGGTSR